MSCIESISTLSSGRRLESSRRGLQPSEPRHGHVQHREIDVLVKGALDRLGAVAGLGHDLQVGLRVEHQAQAAADDRVVVREQDLGLQRDHGRPPIGRSSATSTPPSAPLADIQVAPNHQRALAHPADAAAVRPTAPKSPPSSRTRSSSVPPFRAQGELALLAPAWRTTLVSASWATR